MCEYLTHGSAACTQGFLSCVSSLYLPSLCCNLQHWHNTDNSATRMQNANEAIMHRHGADHGNEKAISAASDNRMQKGHLNFLCIHWSWSLYLHSDTFPISFLVTSYFNLSILSSGLRGFAWHEWKRSQWEQPSSMLKHTWSVPALTGFQLHGRGRITFGIHTLC